MRGRRQYGYTLLELVIVVAILGMIAVIAAPGISSSSDKRLKLAAEESAAAIRFARSESIRTGLAHGFYQQDVEKRIRIFRLDANTNPATLFYDVHNPIDKQIYDFEIGGQSTALVDSLTSTVVYRGICNQPGAIYFDAIGTPRCADPISVVLRSYELRLDFGSASQRVILDGVTGRVTVK